MKKQVLALLGCTLAISLTACTAAPPVPSVPTASAPPSTEAVQSSTEPSIAPTHPALRPMSEAELAPIRELFEADFSLYSQALTSFFETPEEVNLKEFFYNGHMDHRIHPETAQPATGEEMDYFRQRFGADSPIFQMDTTVISTAEMDADLLEVFGLTLDQTHQTGLDRFHYCPRTDRYFLFKGDTNAQCVHFESGLWLDGQAVALTYSGGFGEPCTAVMTQQQGHWYILSNRTSSPSVYEGLICTP